MACQAQTRETAIISGFPVKHLLRKSLLNIFFSSNVALLIKILKNTKLMLIVNNILLIYVS